jgi:hypothetical protein
MDFIKFRCIFLGIQVFYYILSFSKIKVQAAVTATIVKEGGNTGGLRLIIVGGEFSNGKPKLIIILLVKYMGMEVLFQDGLNALSQIRVRW